MKRHFIYTALLAFLIALTSYAKDKTVFTYGPDGKNIFTQADDQILIRFSEGLSFAEKAEILGKEKRKSDTEKKCGE